MVKTLSTLALGVALLTAGCSKKDDPKPAPTPAAPKPTDTPKAEAPKADAPKTEPAKAEPAKAEPAAKAAPAASEPTDDDKTLVRNAPADKSQVDWPNDDGSKLAITATKRLDGDTFVVDLLVGGKVIETIKTGAEKPNADGFHHYEAKASVSSLPDGGILVVVHTSKVTGKAEESYDARFLTWDMDAKKLVVSRSFAFADAYDPKMDK